MHALPHAVKRQPSFYMLQAELVHCPSMGGAVCRRLPEHCTDWWCIVRRCSSQAELCIREPLPKYCHHCCPVCSHLSSCHVRSAGAAARQAAGVAPPLRVVAGALQRLGAALLPLHKATAKLSYVAGSLFVGLLEEGFCTAEDSAEEAAAGEGGTFKEAEGTVSAPRIPRLGSLHVLCHGCLMPSSA